MQHVNAEGEALATAGAEGDPGGPQVENAPAELSSCDPMYWSCPGAAGYKVRGQTYLKVWWTFCCMSAQTWLDWTELACPLLPAYWAQQGLQGQMLMYAASDIAMCRMLCHAVHCSHAKCQPSETIYRVQGQA